MSGTTIATYLHQSVTVGASSYPSPLTINQSGTILPSVAGGTGLITSLIAGASIANNDGVVLGAAGAAGQSGGTALSASNGATISSIGTFAGGAGGTLGGIGGTGIYIADGTSFTNSNYYGPTLHTAIGTITGGTGGSGTLGGTGGIGAIVNDATLSNLSSDIITGGAGGGGVITNGAGGTGIVLNGGSFINVGGTVVGGAGGTNAAGGAAAILNAGVLYDYSLLLGGDGGTGGAGVVVQGGTLIDRGLIKGGNNGTADAISFTGSGTLAIIPGATFIGNVLADSGAADVLVLESAGSGQYLGGIGSSILNFASLDFAAGAGWTVAGSEAGLTGLEISGFTSADMLIINGVTASSASYVVAKGILLATGGGTDTIHVSGSFAGQAVYFSNTGGGVDLLIGSPTSIISGDTLLVDGFTPVGTTLAAGSMTNITLLDITGTGIIDPAIAGRSGIDIASHTMAIINDGTVMGGPGIAGTQGGAAALLSGNITLTNATGALIAGAASDNISADPGQDGGIGISATGTITLENDGTIAGGAGGKAVNQGGTGAVALAADGAGSIDNTGTIIGGDGASGTFVGGDGGAGAMLAGSVSLLNQGLIIGGRGDSGQGTAGGAGGAGLVVTGTNFVLNEATITGGQGNYGGDDAGDGGTGVGFAGAGTFINAGVIQGGQGGNSFKDGGQGGTGVSVTGTGIFVNEGSITTGDIGLDGTGGVAAFISGSTLINAGTISAGQSATTAVAFGAAPGMLVDDPGAVFTGNVVANAVAADTLALAGTSAVALSGIGSQFLNFNDIEFEAGAHRVLEGNTLGLAEGTTISGFSVGDTIVLDDFSATSLSFANNELVLSAVYSTPSPSPGASPDSIVSLTLDISGNFESDDFSLLGSSDSYSGATTIALNPAVICFLKGTNILTATGERQVEELAIGDELVTRFGGMQQIKWIGRQSFSAIFTRNNQKKTPVRIAAGALGKNLPCRDLFVSPGHSMLLGDILVLARDLVNGVTIVQDEPAEDLHYYQIEFEKHDCVVAEDVWSESYADAPGLRAAFHNASDYYALYPEALPPTALNLCAPRPETGPLREAALRHIVARASAQAGIGKLKGWVEEVTPDGFVRGWAMDEAFPELPVLLEVLYDGEVIHTILASEHRDDLAQAGLGRGYHGFTLTLPDNRRWHATRIAVRRAKDGAPLALISRLNAKRAS